MNARADFERFERATDPDIVSAMLAGGLERSGQRPIEISVAIPRAFPRHGGGFTLEYRALVRQSGASAATPLRLGAHLLGAEEPWPAYARTDPERVLVALDLRLVVPLFPYDPELAVLPQLVDPERALALVRDIVPWVGGTFDPDIHVEVLGYRLERRCVLRYRDRNAGERRREVCVAKTLRPQKVVALQHILRLLEPSPLAEFMPHTWAVDEQRGIHWMESVPARSLHELLEAPAFVEGCQEAARALRTLHRLRPDRLPRFTAPDALRELRQTVALAEHLFPARSPDFMKAQALLEARCPAVPTTLACIHRDFYDKQVLHAVYRTTLLDWEGLAVGDPAQDHGNFAAHLVLRQHQVPRHDAFIQGGAQAFRASYGATSSEFDRRSRWWQSATLVRLASLYAFRRRWRHLTEPLLLQAQRLLASPPSHAVLSALVLTLVLTGAVWAERPEFMQLGPRVGQTLEIEGDVDTSGVFVAKNIEVLPKARAPMLRAAIAAIDHEAHWIQLLGLRLQVPPDVQSDDPDSLRVAFAALRPGLRVEVSCRATARGDWVVRRMQTYGVKASTKIKGTITRAAVDGTPPDTLEIAGLVILLTARTAAGSGSDALEDVLFGALASRRAPGNLRGAIAGGRLLVQTECRGELLLQNDLDLSTYYASDADATRPQLRVALSGYWAGGLRTHAQVRVRKPMVLTSDLGATSAPTQLQLTELFALWKGIGGKGIALQCGRQDFDEPREWIFDEYLDAVRLYAVAHEFVLETAWIHPVHALNPKFASWTDSFLMARWQVDPKRLLAAWLLWRQDDDATRERQPLWYGLRWWGRATRWLQPWLDVASMRGTDKGRRLRAWAVDVGTTWRAGGVPWSPALTLGYAVGSGDASTADGIDGNFRQTGYEDNFGRLGGVVPLRYYGSLLEPELSNIEIATASFAVQPIADASVEVLLHRYAQRDALASLRSHNLVDPPARPNGMQRQLGWGLDVVAAGPSLWNVVRLQWTSAFFVPGAAFSPRQKTATLHRMELAARF